MTRVISTVEFREDRGLVQIVAVPTPFEVVHAELTVREGGVDVITIYVLHVDDAGLEDVSFRLVPTCAPIAGTDVHVASVPRPVAMFGHVPAVLHLFRARTMLEWRGDT